MEYEGELHCRAVHEPSGTVLSTDAPKDNQGRGESFFADGPGGDGAGDVRADDDGDLRADGGVWSLWGRRRRWRRR